MKKTLGALKPKVDKRDYKIVAAAMKFPESYLCTNLPLVKNQQNVNSCVAHATAAILETFNKTETGTFVPLSTDFIYGMQGILFNKMTGGMYLRDACKIIKEYGNPSERTIGGNTEQPECTEILKTKLNEEVYKEARQYRIKSYAQCKTANDIKHALMNYGPILGSVKWYDKCSFNNKEIIFDKTSNFGYHAIMVCGWNEKGWVCQNSWGRNWNGDGTFIYPYGEKFMELWSFVDADNNDITIPKNNCIFDTIYKIINIIINFFGRWVQ